MVNYLAGQQSYHKSTLRAATLFVYSLSQSQIILVFATSSNLVRNFKWFFQPFVLSVSNIYVCQSTFRFTRDITISLLPFLFLFFFLF